MSDEIKPFPAPVVDAPSSPKGLIRKLCEVMAAVERIPKRGLNEHQHYNYVMEADLCDAVRLELANRNIMVFPNMTSVDRTPVGERQHLTTVNITFTFVDGDSGEFRDVNIIGTGADVGDKGIYKAITGATKYLIMKTFFIATGDDPEGDERTDRESGKEAAKAVGDDKLAKFKEREAAQLAEVQDHKFFTQAAAPETVTKAALPSFRKQVEGIENVRGLLRKVTEAKTTDKKTDFLKLLIGDTEVSLFDNLVFDSPVRGCKDLFSLLATSINELCDLEILTKPSKNPAKPYRNVKAKGSVLLIGPVEIENGVPVIQQRREPGE